MHIEHLAIWVSDLELMRDFYMKYFGAVPNRKYENPVKQFASYFLTFKGGARLEIMTRLPIDKPVSQNQIKPGLAHFAVSVGSKENVIAKTEELRKNGYLIESKPRTTGDGYFESVVLDPEGNFIEITI